MFNFKVVRLSLTNKEARALYYEIQSRREEIKAKNVDSRRKKRAIVTQLKSAIGLRRLSLTAVRGIDFSMLFSSIANFTKLTELRLEGNYLRGTRIVFCSLPFSELPVTFCVSELRFPFGNLMFAYKSL